jgi:type IV pilus assembly protein PilE
MNMKTLTTYKHSTSGFTLIELMITVAVIGVLSAIAYPSYVSYIEKGKRAECRSGLLKTMQQQERYFTQRNTYIAFTSGSTTATVGSFSGETLAKSACNIAATTCATGDEKSCIELVATPSQYTDSKVTNWYLDSAGQKQCKLNGATVKVVDTQTCWP